MNVSFHPTPKPVVPDTLRAGEAAQAEAASPAGAFNDKGLSIAEARADAIDVPELDIPDAALDRSDRLGQLVDAAFHLPAPPPDFTNR